MVNDYIWAFISLYKLGGIGMNLFRHTRIRTRLIIAFTVILLVPSLAIAGSSYYFAKKTLETEMLHTSNELITNVKSQLEATIQEQINQLNFTSLHIEQNFNDIETKQKEALAYVINLEKSFDNVLFAYIGTSKGSMITSDLEGLGENYDPRERDWFKEAIAKPGQIVISPPYEDPSTHDLVITLSQSLANGSVVGLDLKVTSIKKLLNQITIGNEGYAFLTNSQGEIIVHPSLKANDKLNQNVTALLTGSESNRFKQANKQWLFTTEPATGWKVIAQMDEREFTNGARPIFVNTLIILCITIAIGGLINHFIVRSISNPLTQLVRVSKQVSKGILTDTIAVTNRDEIGVLSNSFNQMIMSLRTIINKANTTSIHINTQSKALLHNVQETSASIKENARAIDEISLGSSTQQQVAEENARATELLSQSIQEIANTSVDTHHVSVKLTEQAKNGQVMMTDVHHQMNDIYTSSEETGKVVSVLSQHVKEIEQISIAISTISDQITLLALNAQIEAARAGDMGAGFAVVANEVGKLAEQSKTSTKQITAILQGIQTYTNDVSTAMKRGEEKVMTGMNLVKQTSSTFNDIILSIESVSKNVESVSSAIQEMAASTEEISASIEETAAIATENAVSTQTMVTSSQHQLAKMEEFSTAMNELSSLSNELQQEMNQFKLSD
ncbi:methyl-accepting chemotaxis protein [Priestia megaterium]|nr:methyl-accepting chemotaxis protein [Priestia megaterium]